MEILKLIALLCVPICMAWTMVGRWRKVPAPRPVLIVDFIATIGLMGWIIWLAVGRGL